MNHNQQLPIVEEFLEVLAICYEQLMVYQAAPMRTWRISFDSCVNFAR